MARRFILHWFWPRRLSHRVALILVAGMLAAQALTGTIWFERRNAQLFEVPTRVVAARTADFIRHLDTEPPEERAEVFEALNSPQFRIHAQDDFPVRGPDRFLDGLQRLIADVAATKAGRRIELRLQTADLLGDDGRPANRWSFSKTAMPTAHFVLGVRRAPGEPWIRIDALEDESGQDTHWGEAITDYLLRIYGVRMVLIVGLALIAMRLAMAPLDRLARAAEALGRDIRSAPLDTRGPVEVARAAQAFNHMQHSLIESVEQRDRFLAAVSHDLRSPITRLRLRAEMLRDPEARDRFREDVAEMQAMVEATLNFVRSGSDEDERHEVDMNALLASIAQGWVSQGHDVTLEGTAQRPLRCSELGMRRCFQNIVENAVRYGGRAQIRIIDSAERFRATVSDDGPGIVEDQLERVMEPFYRVEASRNASDGGVGLGLSIARTIAGVHGGTLTLANRATGGLEATLDIVRE